MKTRPDEATVELNVSVSSSRTETEQVWSLFSIVISFQFDFGKQPCQGSSSMDGVTFFLFDNPFSSTLLFGTELR